MHKFKSFLAHLTHQAGVYQMLDEEGKVLYVGKAKNLKKRVSSYFSRQVKDPKTALLVLLIDRIEITVAPSESEAVFLECNLIKEHQPKFNVLLRDDKSYPYIAITTKHPFPRIDLHRGQKRKGDTYFGPFPSAQAVRETTALIQKIFRLRTCRDTYFAARTRPCLLYQIGRCTGPCVNLVSEAQYHEQVELATLFLAGKNQQVIEQLQIHMEAAAKQLNYEAAANDRDQIFKLRQIQGNPHQSHEAALDVIGLARDKQMGCIQLLTIRHSEVIGSRSYYPHIPADTEDEDILDSFITQHYLQDQSHIESIPHQIISPLKLKNDFLLAEALATLIQHRVTIHTAVRGLKKKWLNMATTSAKQSLSLHMYHQASIEQRMEALKSELELPIHPARIECFDISHTMGEATVGSCVVFDEQGPVKNEYRRYNIQGVGAGDDVKAIYRVVFRRLKSMVARPEKMPDLILIDGGQTQLNAAKKAAQALELGHLYFMDISKGMGRKPGLEQLHLNGHRTVRLNQDSRALHFLQQIRDEAHRFAILGHRQKRDKKRQQSTLEYIPGIGAKRRRELLRYFGGIQGVTHASLDELFKVPGISRKIAERIFAALHDTII